ncbi:MAG: helix-hairpin-helix domain-containing protein [Kineosporiaceae bacterium]
MSWYLGQSWLIILLSVLLGLVIGWALWRRPWHKRYHSESEAITRVTRDHAKTLSEKDAEISRLRGLLDERGASSAAVAADTGRHAAGSDVDATVADAVPDESAEETMALDLPEAADAGAVASPLVDSSASVDVSDVDAPAVQVEQNGHSVDVQDVDTPDVDVSDDATAAAQVSALTTATAPAEAAVEGEADTANDGAAAAATAATAEDEEDDLERVEGIGPRIGSALRAAGITTFEGLATSDVARLQSALEAAGLRFAPSLPTWARQARLLADGDEEGFLKLTEQLVGGRDIGRRA